MNHVNIHTAKTNLSKLIEKAISGEEVIIAKGNKPLVKLVVLDEMENERKLGQLNGQIYMSDDFNSPLDDFEDYQ